jgi:pyridoxine 5-phosphate synthase
MAINLSINLNKVALLRNSRGGTNPSPRVAAETCIRAGVQGLTLHWRQDERHTRASDVREIAALCHARGVEFNLEGDTRLELLELAIEVRATQFTLVPVTPGEVTSDHGWDLPRQHELIAPLLERAERAGLRTAIFMDPVADAMAAAARTGTRRVELYTEPYAAAFGTAGGEAAFVALRDAARTAHRLGLGVNAGHDLDLRNTPRLAREIPEMLEVSIGHALLADALYLGLDETIRRYLAACRGEDVAAPVTR